MCKAAWPLHAGRSKHFSQNNLQRFPHQCGRSFPAPCRGASQRGHSLSQKRMAPLEPQEKDFDWQSQARMAFVPPEGDCLRAALPRLELLYDLPLLLSSAVAQPLAALLPYGCGTPLAGAALESERKCSVITCCRWHNIAASAAKPHSVGSLPPNYRHSRLTIVRRGCKTVTKRTDSWRSHVHRT